MEATVGWAEYGSRRARQSVLCEVPIYAPTCLKNNAVWPARLSSYVDFLQYAADMADSAGDPRDHAPNIAEPVTPWSSRYRPASRALIRRAGLVGMG
jgi:hypothetical protein